MTCGKSHSSLWEITVYALMISDNTELKVGGNVSKETVEGFLNLDILDLKREGLLKVAAGVPSEIKWTTNGKAYSTVGYVLEKYDGIPDKSSDG
jgi:hypothetical protein